MKLLLLLMLLLVPRASAHELKIAGPQNPHELLRAWSFEPGVVIPLLLSGFLYASGVLRLRKASPASARKIDIYCFGAGWLALVVALVSPIHPWGSVLFSAH